LRDEEAMDWRGGFPQLPWDKESKLEKLGGEEFLGFFFLCDFSWKREERDEESW
jgi:hypothetical protein